MDLQDMTPINANFHFKYFYLQNIEIQIQIDYKDINQCHDDSQTKSGLMSIQNMRPLTIIGRGKAVFQKV